MQKIMRRGNESIFFCNFSVKRRGWWIGYLVCLVKYVTIDIFSDQLTHITRSGSIYGEDFQESRFNTKFILEESSMEKCRSAFKCRVTPMSTILKNSNHTTDPLWRIYSQHHQPLTIPLFLTQSNLSSLHYAPQDFLAHTTKTSIHPTPRKHLLVSYPKERKRTERVS